VSTERFIYFYFEIPEGQMLGNPGSTVVEAIKQWLSEIEAHPEGDIVIIIKPSGFSIMDLGSSALEDRERVNGVSRS